MDPEYLFFKPPETMKVFLSWSGDLSHKVACTLRDWLPMVIQSVKPYVSSEDIDKGTRWSTDIARELEQSTYGILCITKANIDAPWINFEAGALSKAMDKSFVSPFLFRMKRSDVRGPLLQFQSTVYERDDVLKLLSSINSRLPADDQLDDTQLQKSFDVWWPQLEAQVGKIPEDSRADDTSKRSHDVPAILEELLDLARSQQKLLRSPSELIPPEYLEIVLREARHANRAIEEGAEEAHVLLLELMRRLRPSDDSPVAIPAPELREELERIHSALHQAMGRGGRLSHRRPHEGRIISSGAKRAT